MYYLFFLLFSIFYQVTTQTREHFTQYGDVSLVLRSAFRQYGSSVNLLYNVLFLQKLSKMRKSSFIFLF